MYFFIFFLLDYSCGLKMLNRLKARLRILLRHGEELNRRVEIENQLLQIAAGKKPLPGKDQCRVMALKLGTPKEYWSKKLNDS